MKSNEKKRCPSRATLAKLSAELVSIETGKPLTTSLTIAEKFGRRHDHVLRAIENTISNGSPKPQSNRLKIQPIEETEDAVNLPKIGEINRRKSAPVTDPQRGEIQVFSKQNFIPSTYKDDRGREQPMYLLTEAGCMKIILSFTGPDADVWQIRFINAFERMKDRLEQITRRQYTFDWKLAREEGKAVRREFTDSAQRFITAATEQCSKNAEWYYKNLTNAVYYALFEPPKAAGVKMRDCLNADQLDALKLVEKAVDRTLEQCLEAGMPYKEIYKVAKQRAITIGNALGREEPGREPLPTPQQYELGA